MSKSKKYILAAVSVLAVVALIPVIGLGIVLATTAVRDSKPANYYADTWNIKFPESAKEIYTLRTDGRDWDRFSIYMIAPGDDAALEDCLEVPIGEKTSERIMDFLEYVQVPTEMRPDLEKPYRWKCIREDGGTLEEIQYDFYEDNMFVLYDEQTNTVYTLLSHGKTPSAFTSHS